MWLHYLWPKAAGLSWFRRKATELSQDDPVVLGVDVERSLQIGRDEQSDPARLDRLLAGLGLLGEEGPEVAACHRHADADLGGVEPSCLEGAPQDPDRARRHLDGHGGNGTWGRR